MTKVWYGLYNIYSQNANDPFQSCITTIGGEGNNVAIDLEEEHFVQFDKKPLKGMGAQKTFKAVERATRAACGV